MDVQQKSTLRTFRVSSKQRRGRENKAAEGVVKAYLGGPDSLHLAQQPVLGRVQALHVLLGAATLANCQCECQRRRRGGYVVKV